MLMALLSAAVIPGFTLVRSTARADYYVAFDQPNLKVDSARCERFLERTEKQFGVVVPRFEYLRVGTAGEVSQVVGKFADGYAFSAREDAVARIISVHPCHKHEIVHLVSFQLGRPAEFFEEGVASAWAHDYNSWAHRGMRRTARNAELRYEHLMPEPRLEGAFGGDLEAYVRDDYVHRLGSAWVKHLTDRYGVAKFVLLLRAMGTACRSNDCWEEFALVYGVDPYTEFDTWLYGHKGPPRE